MTDYKPRDYCNNLEEGNRVFHVPTGREGIVTKTPRETSTTTAVQLDGRNCSQYLYVGDLRFIPPNANPPGSHEDVAPHDGELPPAKRTAVKPAKQPRAPRFTRAETDQAPGPHRPTVAQVIDRLQRIPSHLEVESIVINGQQNILFVTTYHEGMTEEHKHPCHL